MCESVERYADGKRIDTLRESVRNFMESMKLSAEQTIMALKISDNDRAILLNRL